MTMTKTRITGQTYVGDLRLTALDVGFDLRLHDYAVQLPESFRSVGLDIGGETYLIEGTRNDLITTIRAAGYVVAERTERRTP